MNIRTEVREGKGIVTVCGPLNAACVDSFREQMHRWMEEHETVRQLILDAGEMDFVDSAGLGVLIALLKRATERGGDIRIARLQNKARIVFEITRAFKIFEIFDTVEEALRAEA